MHWSIIAEKILQKKGMHYSDCWCEALEPAGSELPELFPLDGMLVHRRSLPRNLLDFPRNLPVPINTPGWNEAPSELNIFPGHGANPDHSIRGRAYLP